MLSDINIAKTDLHAQLEKEGEAVRTTHVMLSAAGDTAIQVEKNLQSLDVKIAEVCSELTVEKTAHNTLKQLLRVEKQLAYDLGGSLKASKQAAEDVMEECKNLFGLVQQLWEEKAALEGQVMLVLYSKPLYDAALHHAAMTISIARILVVAFSFILAPQISIISIFLSVHNIHYSQIMETSASWGGACQVLRTKLQAALKEEVNLLESVQQLQAEKSVLEAKLVAMQTDLEQMVSIVNHPCHDLKALVEETRKDN
jgi:chromosome segregation ATPase